MTESEQLSKFQAVLLDTLSESRTPEDWLTALLASPSSAPFRDYVAGFQPPMLEVASELINKWGRSSPTVEQVAQD
ncbi:MAG: hypothetical protein DWI21_04795 [Planctomycetota bacterium]|nr:MAG: hypothetical protein DWI21_04795 [Planctomycetota bacterium]GDY10764.1 hypothetical protein LBMAG52_42520 [Planctomycetia bacterium]